MFKLSLYVLLCWVGTNAETYTNPIAPNSPDPWLQYYKGYYYLVATSHSSTSNIVGVRKAKTLGGLSEAEYQTLHTIDGFGIWAPEIHLIDEKWYLFYAACASGATGNCHRNYVAESESDDPMGPYTLMANLADPNEEVQEIDPSYIIIDDKQYLMTSYDAKLSIRPMINPYTPEGQKRFLSEATYDWEKSGGPMNEGPEPLYHDDKVFVVYSSSGCGTPDYKLGLLEFTGTDPLNSTHWTKHPEPVFQRSDENKVYGPGHNGFFKSPDGTEDWIVYHANDLETEGCGETRSARAQKFTWGDDGLPVMGVPEAIDVEYDGPSGE